ncbi:formamidopyrimidine-DNA glycosylase [Rippkaea orientalis PCC 8801]|uniref:Formamidopyrimidine-DNA glycosylase n=1 Tax=Rippkaea orientalis (strain PCC 8801 / RF-1) TaxID=41431 RepID=FPG_RIPO1|nr:DNA-formamidopyrimidine glycosylase [Rippkaea orientalis]B7K1T1.1 RecName: Full=Formamidopyrimidine-DNA glycosylase; Short=Fapy-DNA glycosylase; AltName: Full=DNA-(apurinic or apyrimidinic site) lyase MutM; Short=AP lyase MutM [Rippkaea orientalis PCC 8801]ACK64238.1 formamidopyrimidine-DNA glycosylase [Rippkaea orientalis PCC 8801]
MPELPEVETVCRGLNELTSGKVIKDAEVLLPRSLASPSSVDEFLSNIRGVIFGEWQRRGKYLLGTLVKESGEAAGWLGVHLRMTGQLLWVNQSEPLQIHTRLRLFCGENKELRFVDIRTFGKVWCVPPKTTPETIITGLKKLGVEPFSDDFSDDYFTTKLNGRQRNIKTLLLDQEIVAGLGNIYADEALFKSGVHPTTLGKNLKPQQIEQLRIAIIEVLETAIEKGGTTFSDFKGVTGINGNYGGTAWVYGRTGEPCRVCGTSIERLKLGGRSAHFCPRCQA